MITVRTEKETFTVKLTGKREPGSILENRGHLRNPARGEENIENAESFCEQKAEILPEEQEDKRKRDTKAFYILFVRNVENPLHFVLKNQLQKEYAEMWPQHQIGESCRCKYGL